MYCPQAVTPICGMYYEKSINFPKLYILNYLRMQVITRTISALPKNAKKMAKAYIFSETTPLFLLKISKIFTNHNNLSKFHKADVIFVSANGYWLVIFFKKNAN